MADPEHLEHLKKGVEHWNKWRKENHLIKPDFYEANLFEADLRSAGLSRVDFRGANLRGAYISGANIRESDLSRAKLFRADLRNANLVEAKLRGADLSGATLWETHFSDVDLSKVKGLENCKHDGPSSVDHRTLMRSGNLPDVFLRGCGFLDQFIQYLPSLLGSLDPIQFYSCFISYSHKDEEFAKRLYADLQAKGIRCWFAPQDLDIVDKIKDEIEEAIRIHDKLIIVLSENSLTRAWVVKEVNEGLEQEKIRNENVLFPVRLDDAIDKTTQQWAFDLKAERIVGDFSNWKDHDSYQKTFKLLLRALGKKD